MSHGYLPPDSNAMYEWKGSFTRSPSVESLIASHLRRGEIRYKDVISRYNSLNHSVLANAILLVHRQRSNQSELRDSSAGASFDSGREVKSMHTEGHTSSSTPTHHKSKIERPVGSSRMRSYIVCVTGHAGQREERFFSMGDIQHVELDRRDHKHRYVKLHSHSYISS